MHNTHKHVTYVIYWRPPRLLNENRRTLTCSTAAARTTAISLRNEANMKMFILIFVFGVTGDMRSECMITRHSWGKARIGTDTPGIMAKVITVPRVLCQTCRTNRTSFGYGYANLAKLTEGVPGTV